MKQVSSVVLIKLATKAGVGRGQERPFPPRSATAAPGSYRISSLWFLALGATCPLRKEPFWLRSSFPFSRSGQVKMASSLSSSDSECIRLVLRTWAFCLPPSKERDSRVKNSFNTGQQPHLNSIPCLSLLFLSCQRGSLIRLPRFCHLFPQTLEPKRSCFRHPVTRGQDNTGTQ